MNPPRDHEFGGASTDLKLSLIEAYLACIYESASPEISELYGTLMPSLEPVCELSSMLARKAICSPSLPILELKIDAARR